MTQDQKDALINYIEFGLISLVENVSENSENTNNINYNYDEAYKLLIDFDESFQSIVDQNQPITHYKE